MSDVVIINQERRDVATLTDDEIAAAVLAIEERGSDAVCKLADETFGDPSDGGEYVRFYFAAYSMRYGMPFSFSTE